MPTFEVVTDKGTFELTADREPTPAEAQAAIMGQIQAEQATPPPAPPEQGDASAPSIAIPSMGDVASTAASVGLPIAGAIGGGALAGPPGAIAGGIAGGAAGEAARAKIQGEPIQPGAVAAEGVVGGIGAIPFLGKPAATALRGAVIGGLKGAALGAAAPTARALIKDGDLPHTSDLALSTTAGLLFGAGAGALQAKIAAAAVPQPEVPPLDVPPAAPITDVPAVPLPEPPSGGFSLNDLPQGLFQKEFTPEFFGRLNARLQNAPDQLEALAQNSQRQRLYHAIADEMEASGADPEFVKFFKNTVRSDAQKLNFLSQLRRSMKEMEADNPALATVTKQIDEAVGSGPYQVLVKDPYTKVANFRRGLLTTNPATTMRNIYSQSVAYSTAVLDKAAEGAVSGNGMGQADELLWSFARALKPGQRAKFDGFYKQLLRAHPRIANKLEAMHEASIFDSVAEPLTLGRKITRVLNLPNRVQERFFRRALFDGSVRGQLRERGLDVGEYLLAPGQIPEDILTDASNLALDYTFSNTPDRGTFARAVLDTYKQIPMLMEIDPFPRFQFNAYKFILDHNPLGVMGTLFKGANGIRKWNNATLRNKAIAKASVGTAFMATGFALRASRYAGEKWYQVTNPDTGTTADLRPYYPLSFFPFAAEVAMTLADIGSDVITDGKTLQEAMKVRRGMTAYDFGLGLIAMNNLSGTALGLTDAFMPGATAQQTGNFLRDYAANFIGGFTVPFRAMKDAVSGIDAEESILRDTRDSILGKAQENIPFLSQRLPERQGITRAGAQAEEHSWRKQLTGLRTTTANVVEKELARLHIPPSQIDVSTGDPKIDRVLNRYAAEYVEKLFPKFTKGNYARRTDAEKTIMLTAPLRENGFFAGMRQGAMERLALTHPQYAQALKAKRVSDDVEVLLNEKGKHLPAAP